MFKNLFFFCIVTVLLGCRLSAAVGYDEADRQVQETEKLLKEFYDNEQKLPYKRLASSKALGLLDKVAQCNEDALRDEECFSAYGALVELLQSDILMEAFTKDEIEIIEILTLSEGLDEIGPSITIQVEAILENMRRRDFEWLMSISERMGLLNKKVKEANEALQMG